MPSTDATYPLRGVRSCGCVGIKDTPSSEPRIVLECGTHGARSYPGHRPRRAFAPDPRPGIGDCVNVGPMCPAGTDVGAMPILDGKEGPGVIEAADEAYARVRLDDGRVVVGVRRSRLARAT